VTTREGSVCLSLRPHAAVADSAMGCHSPEKRNVHADSLSPQPGSGWRLLTPLHGYQAAAKSSGAPPRRLSRRLPTPHRCEAELYCLVSSAKVGHAFRG